MDITRHDFLENLPTVLKHISKSTFIAFDLELSGIPPQNRRNGSDRATLQDRYRAVKTAAEVYQILQVGITTVEEDPKNAQYLIRPFNFNLSPLVPDELGIDRDFTYSASAVDFLLRNNYDMSLPFTKGIPYLTQAEANKAKSLALKRLDRDAIPDIDLRADDHQARAFMKRTKASIEQWQSKNSSDSAERDVLEILDEKRPLNRFQRRLVHQLVRASFPTLTTLGRADSVAVQLKDQDDLDHYKYSVQRRVEAQLTQQTGFRWVADALAGRERGEMDVGMLGRKIDDEEPAKGFESFNGRIKDLFESCKRRRKVLVGHNCFLDFVFFYKFFYGDLPETVVEFQKLVHEIFPLVFDTKFMATYGPEGARYRSWQLAQIADVLAKEKRLVISYPANHNHYAVDDTSKYHEAGFDSFETAKVFLRLASKLQSHANPATSKPSFKIPDSAPLQPLQDVAAETTQQAAITTNKKRAKKSNKSTPTTSRPTSSHKPGANGRFSHENIYESLSDADMEAAVSDVSASPSPSKAGKDGSMAQTLVNSSNAHPRGNETSGADDSLADKMTRLDLRSGDSSRNGLLPDFEDSFYAAYANKLRCFGTVEEECNLSPVLKAEPKSTNPLDDKRLGTQNPSSGIMQGAAEQGWADVDPHTRTDRINKPSIVKKVVDFFTSG